MSVRTRAHHLAERARKHGITSIPHLDNAGRDSVAHDALSRATGSLLDTDVNRELWRTHAYFTTQERWDRFLELVTIGVAPHYGADPALTRAVIHSSLFPTSTATARWRMPELDSEDPVVRAVRSSLTKTAGVPVLDTPATLAIRAAGVPLMDALALPQNEADVRSRHVSDRPDLAPLIDWLLERRRESASLGRCQLAVRGEYVSSMLDILTGESEPPRVYAQPHWGDQKFFKRIMLKNRMSLVP